MILEAEAIMEGSREKGQPCLCRAFVDAGASGRMQTHDTGKHLAGTGNEWATSQTQTMPGSDRPSKGFSLSDRL